MGLTVEDGKLKSSTADLSISSNGASATVLPVSSGIDSQSPRKKAVAPMGPLGSSSPILAPEFTVGSGSSVQVSSSCLTQSLNMPILSAEVVQAIGELGSSSLASICPLLEPAKMKVMPSGDPIEKMTEKSSSLAATKEEDDELLGLEEPFGIDSLQSVLPFRMFSSSCYLRLKTQESQPLSSFSTSSLSFLSAFRVIDDWVGGFRGWRDRRLGLVGFVDGVIGDWVSGFRGWHDRRLGRWVSWVDGVIGDWVSGFRGWRDRRLGRWVSWVDGVIGDWVGGFRGWYGLVGRRWRDRR
nr:hypothetical protein CFP56_06851 [Quercus suber]